MRDENQLHAAVVELVALDDRDQVLDDSDWYPGDKDGKADLNFGQARLCAGRGSKSRGRSRDGSPHLEVSGLHPAGEIDRRVLFGATTNNWQQATPARR